MATLASGPGLAWRRLGRMRARLALLSATRAVVLLAVLFLLLLAAGDAVLLWIQRVWYLEDLTQDAANLTVVLEQDVRLSLLRLDGGLQDLIAADVRADASPVGRSPDASMFRHSSLVDEWRIYGADGKMKYGSARAGPHARGWSAQEAFVRPRDLAGPALFIGKPVLEDGQWRIPLSRRISGKDGAFRGVAVILVDIDAFSGFFRSIRLGRHGSIAVIRRDGQIIVRYPPVAGTPNESVAGSPIFQKQIAPLEEGMVSGTSSIDGVVKIGHFRSVQGLPLVVVVFSDEADALAAWWNLVRLYLGILAAVALAVALLVALIWRQQAGLATATEAVRAEQRRVETVTSRLPAVLMQRIRERDGTVRFPYISRSAEEMLGISPGLLGANPETLTERMAPADAAALVLSLKRSARELSDINQEFRFAHPDGTDRWLRLSARSRRLENGATVLEGLFLDVTAHKAAVADKQALEQRLEAIMDNVPGVVFQRVLGADGRARYTFISPAVQTLFGVRPEEVLRDQGALIERIVPEDRHIVEDRFSKQPSGRSEWHREFQVVGPDGLLRWVRGTATRHVGAGGETFWDGIFLDISMQRAAVAATRALQRRMEAIVAEIPGAVFECVQSAAGARFTFLSPQAEAIFAVPAREALLDFDRIKANVVPEDRPLLDARLAQHWGDQKDWIEEFRVRSPAGPVRWVRGTARARRREDSTLVWIGVFQDVTQAKIAEEAAQRAQRNQALAHLTAGVAHEFNNLLTVIQGDLELLAGGLGKKDELVASALHAAERGANVTRALQAYARRQALRPVTGKIPDMLREVTVLLNSILGHSIRLELALSEDLWPIHVDWDQLGNALVILTVNSRQAMPNGGTLRLEAANTTLSERLADLEPGDYVRITVMDSGQGMPDDLRKHAFDPFYSSTTVGGGSALGLSTVFGFVKQSHGHVALDSRKGEGTTVTILLPRGGDGGGPAAGFAEPA